MTLSSVEGIFSISWKFASRRAGPSSQKRASQWQHPRSRLHRREQYQVMNPDRSATPHPAPAAGGASFEKLASAVARHPFLQGFSKAQLEQLARSAQLRDYQPAHLIFKQGDPARDFYLIEWGAISLTHAGLKGNTVIQTLTAGDALGWSWLFPPYGWHFNAMTAEPTRLVEFDGERLGNSVASSMTLATNS